MLPLGITRAALCTRPCSPLTGVYNPKAFVPHAASLGQACAHCRRFSTAASRRSLGSVSVPVCRATLARPVGIAGLVGRYPANDLIPRRPVSGRNRTYTGRGMPPRRVAGNCPRFPAVMPDPEVGCRRLTHPCATGAPPRGRPVRLACLIHAANVHSEPGSNPSIFVSLRPARLATHQPLISHSMTRFGLARYRAFVKRPNPACSTVLCWQKNFRGHYRIVKDRIKIPGCTGPKAVPSRETSHSRD